MSFVLLAALLAATMVAPALASPQAGGVWIVTLDDDHPSARHAEVLAQRDGGTVRHVYSHALNGFSFRGSEQAARNLERHPGVTRVEADQPVQATGHAVPTGVARIDAPTAHASGHHGQGVKVAVLDTGIDSGHPALDVDVASGKNCLDGGSTEDDNSHGTHVAGTASASVLDSAFVGAATHAELVPVKVLDANGSGSWESVICGVDHVTAKPDIGVANMSLSGSGSAGDKCDASGLREAICASVAAGTTYTVAAGNSGADAANSVPAAYPEVITVSALDEERCVRLVGNGPPTTECDEGLASFSNYGVGVDVIAPGVSIHSTLPGGIYGTKSGTSMAAPHVAGLTALLLAADATLTPTGVVDLLRSTGECPDGAVNGSAGPCAGQGEWFRDPDGIAEPLLNAPRAAEAVGEPTEPTDPDPADDEPVADFTVACTELSCDFTDESTVDADLTIADRNWDFDDGGSSTEQDPTHAYAAGGTYTVTLTVTDSAGQADTAAQDVVVTGPGDQEPGDGFDLRVTPYKVRGLQQADLSWTPTTGIDVWRDGAAIATDVGGGSYTDEIGGRGGASYTYRVCDTGTDTCSAPVTITF